MMNCFICLGTVLAARRFILSYSMKILVEGDVLGAERYVQAGKSLREVRGELDK